MTATIKDVAKKAKVSTATVSLALQDHRRISSGTKKRVLKAVADLNYRPSHVARGLVMKKTHNIGFLLTDDHFLRTEPFYTNIFLGSEFEARDHEFYLMLNTIPENFDECIHLPRFVLEKNVDGVILAGKVPHQIIECLEKVKMPMVFVDYYPPLGDYSAVLIDNVSGGEKATEFLIQNGHTHIAFIGGDMLHPSIRDRFQGYKLALERHKINLDMNRVVTRESATNRSSGYHAAKVLLERGIKFTALFVCNDAMAIGAMQCFREQGKKVPADISIIGFDDVLEDMSTSPPLSSIRVPKIEMGTEGVRLLLGLFANTNQKSKKVLVPVELIPRESVIKIKNKIELNV